MAFSDVFDSLGPDMAARLNALVARREASGCNVYFINVDGRADRRSFQTVERAEAFKATLRANGREIINP